MPGLAPLHDHIQAVASDHTHSHSTGCRALQWTGE